MISAHFNQNAKLERVARLDDTILLMHYSPWLKRNNLEPKRFTIHVHQIDIYQNDLMGGHFQKSDLIFDLI